MVAINYATREVTCKIVYYGPGLSGKTTNLIYVHEKVPTSTKGKMISLATEADRTLYFDFLPINIGKINGFTAKFQLYTVPGQVYYNATRKLVLRGTDGLVFVADSQADKMDENIESLTNLKENLAEYGYNYKELPIVIQYNKRDLPGILPVDELEAKLNSDGWQSFEAEAVNGAGVFDTLKMIIKLVLAKAQSTSQGKPQTSDSASSAPERASAESPKADAKIPSPEQPSSTAPEPVERPAPSPAESRPSVPPPVEETMPAAAKMETETVPGLVRHEAYNADSTEQPAPEHVKDIGPSPSQDTIPADTGRTKVPVTEDASPSERPFPGSSTSRISRRERRITVSDFQPASRSQNDSSLGARIAEDEQKIEEKESNMPRPTMAPSTRVVKKKRGFFKRLFGIK